MKKTMGTATFVKCVAGKMMGSGLQIHAQAVALMLSHWLKLRKNQKGFLKEGM